VTKTSLQKDESKPGGAKPAGSARQPKSAQRKGQQRPKHPSSKK
jgi:YidC/Oxa1 family membrane protein insertase